MLPNPTHIIVILLRIIVSEIDVIRKTSNKISRTKRKRRTPLDKYVVAQSFDKQNKDHQHCHNNTHRNNALLRIHEFFL